jgi:hypothetical protein
LYADALGDVLFDSWFIAPFGKYYWQWRAGVDTEGTVVWGKWNEVQSIIGEFIDGD